MTRTDSLVVGTLVVLLALLAGLVGVPALQPTATATAVAERAGGSPDRSRPARTARASSGDPSRSPR